MKRILQKVFEEEIPITRQIGIQVAYYDGKKLVLTTPLRPNMNHKSTAFGGSIYSAMVLCGWGWLYLKLREKTEHFHLVIFESSSIYHHPIKSDFNAECHGPDEKEWERFFRIFQKKGRAKIRVFVQVVVEGKIAASFTGTYVAHR